MHRILLTHTPAMRASYYGDAALAGLLESGHLAGAAMDVGRAADQMPTPALAAHPAMVATSHVGGLTPQAIAHQALEAVEQVRAILAGKGPPGAVNTESATRLAHLPRA